VEFSEVIRRRRMIRHYSSRPLDPEVIERVLANALRAPSAGFAQRGRRGSRGLFFGIMPENLERFRAEFEIPGDYDPIGAVTVGYRADDLPPQSPRIGELRRDAGEVVHRGQWGQHGGG
jgi:nitroreductase